jgi:hypothetical protein
MTRLITMVAVSGLVLSVAAPALWAADAPSSATSLSAVSTPSAAPSAPSSAPMPQATAPAPQTAVKPQLTAHRIYRPDDHMANQLNREVLAQINANNAANYGSSR